MENYLLTLNTDEMAGLLLLTLAALAALAGMTACIVAALIEVWHARQWRARRMGLRRGRLGGVAYSRNGGLHFIKAGRYGAAVWISRR